MLESKQHSDILTHLLPTLIVQIQVDPIRFLLQSSFRLLHIIANGVTLCESGRFGIVVCLGGRDEVDMELGFVDVEVLTSSVGFV